jgi:hypothetical protein
MTTLCPAYINLLHTQPTSVRQVLFLTDTDEGRKAQKVQQCECLAGI